MGGKPNSPIIIKRKKKVIAGGHHGGAWKVAYADFVTAMMAFFMLMWLLNATTESQRKGIADYFSPTVPLSRISGGGDGAFGGDSTFTEDTLAQNGTGATQDRPSESNAAKGDTGNDTSDSADAGEAAMATVQEALSGMSGESMAADEALRHILTRVTDEGLIIEIYDLPEDPLFEIDSAVPQPVMEELAQMISRVLDLLENEIAVSGFTRAQPVVLVNNSVWQVSTLRANQVRLLLQSGGTDPTRVVRVSGHADRKPVAKNPMAVRNNRIEIVLLRETGK